MRTIYFFIFTTCVLYTTLAQYDYEYEEIEDARLYITNISSRNCSNPGLLCKDCELLVNCVLGDNNEFEEQEVQTCDNGETCLANHCTKDPNPICTDYKFECTGTGVFPDPYNCQKFHYCAVKRTGQNVIDVVEGSEGKTTFSCDAKFGYDPISTYCKINLKDGCPEDNFPVPVCKTSGQSGALVNKSIYYVCVKKNDKLFPKLYVCPHGKIYQNNKCA